MSDSPILIVPYMWIGDFVRCHTVVKLLKQRFPSRAIDVLTTSHGRPAGSTTCRACAEAWWSTCRASAWPWRQHRALADRLRAERLWRALVMPRTWKSALAPCLAGIPARTGFFGEARFGLINDLRWGERRLPRMVDRCAVLALRKGETRPPEWPLPELHVPAADVAAWRQRLGLAADGRTGRWPLRRARSARRSAGRRAITPSLRAPAHRGGKHRLGDRRARRTRARRRNRRRRQDRVSATSPGPTCATRFWRSRQPTSRFRTIPACCMSPPRSARPAIGIFGPTSPWHWAPLNPLAAVIETAQRAALPAVPQAGLPLGPPPSACATSRSTRSHAAVRSALTTAAARRGSSASCRHFLHVPRPAAARSSAPTTSLDRRHLPLPPTHGDRPAPRPGR